MYKRERSTIVLWTQLLGLRTILLRNCEKGDTVRPVPDTSFADLIDWLNQTRGLSQSDIARAGAVNRSRVSDWRGGNSVPSPTTLERLAVAFDLDYDRLMRMCGYRLGAAANAADPDETEIISLFRKVPLEKRPDAKRIIGALGVQPTALPPANRRRDGRLTRQTAEDRNRAARARAEGDAQNNPPITESSVPVVRRLRSDVGLLESLGSRPQAAGGRGAHRLTRDLADNRPGHKIPA